METTGAPAAPTEAGILATLADHGYRSTSPRRAVVAAVMRHERPFTAEQIVADAPDIGRATVYRTLDLLEELGVVRHAHLGHGAPTYSEHQHRHVHLVCHHCGRVDEAPTELLSDVASRTLADLGFHLDATHVALSGTCVDCAHDDEDSADGAPEQDDTAPQEGAEGDR